MQVLPAVLLVHHYGAGLMLEAEVALQHVHRHELLFAGELHSWSRIDLRVPEG